MDFTVYTKTTRNSMDQHYQCQIMRVQGAMGGLFQHQGKSRYCSHALKKPWQQGGLESVTMSS